MEINSEPLMGSITLMNDPEVTNNLIINNGIERQIIVDGQTYNLECIIEIPLNKNMNGGVITRIVDNTFTPFVYEIIDELMIAGEDTKKKTNDLSDNIQTRLRAIAGRGIRIKVNRNLQRMCLNVYNRQSGPQHSHLSLWVNNPTNFQAGTGTSGYIPGCAHYKLDAGMGPGGVPGGNPAETVGFVWNINIDETAPKIRFYFSCTAVPNPFNTNLMSDPFTQAVLDGLNECLRRHPVVFPKSLVANVKPVLDEMFEEATTARRLALAAAEAKAKAAHDADFPPLGGKSLRKKTRRTRRIKKSKKTRKHKRR
jgi:hypothetical protein